MGPGDDALVEYGDAARQRHSRIGAQQDLSRARTDLASAQAGGPDPEIAIRLEVVEQELTVLRHQAGSRSRKRNERRVLDLLLTERLLLEELGFATYADYSVWRDRKVGDDETDLAYLEFARMLVDSAQEWLDAINAGELDPARGWSRSSDSGALEPYLVVPDRTIDQLTTASTEAHGARLEAWTAEPSREATTATADDSAAEPLDRADGDGTLPHLGTTDLDDLALPYWDETA